MSAIPVIRPVSSPQFKNIVFPTDFSPCSALALPYARAIAALYGATVHLMHVVGPEPLVGPLGVYYPQVEDQNTVAQQEMDTLLASGVLEGIPCTRTIDRGPVWDAISRLLAPRGIDLIALGTHGRRGLKHFVMGSVAEQIFRRAACPVLTVGPEVKDGFAHGMLESVLYATDFSAASLGALPYALSLVRMYRSRLILLHAVAPFVAGSEFSALDIDIEGIIEEAKQKLNQLIADQPDIRHQAVVRCWSAPDMILDVAGSKGADLIVMGAHRGTSSHTPWATAHRVVAHARCPVLTVRG